MAMRYVVRDRNWTKVWGVDLELGDAERLKEQVVARGWSRTARVEPMPEILPAAERPAPAIDDDVRVMTERADRELVAADRRRVVFEKRIVRQFASAMERRRG